METGYQGSETSWVEVEIHGVGGDPIRIGGPDYHLFRADDPENSGLMSVTTTKSLSGGAGTWSMVVKPTPQWVDVLSQVVDDDWVDIVFHRHDRAWHVMRGSVDEIRTPRTVSGKNATTETITLGGRDFTKVWENTPLWFNRYTAENVAGALVIECMTGQTTILEMHVDEVLDLVLKGFLQKFGERGRANWVLPRTLGHLLGPTMVENFLIRSDMPAGTWRVPERTAISTNFMMPDGNCWTMAREWSDPQFCEMWGDQLPENPTDQTDLAELSIDQSRMVVMLRDRPFVLSDAGLDSPWFKLPMYVVPLQQLRLEDTGRSGLERYNAFFVSPQVMQNALGNAALDLVAPLWDTEDMKAHGLRRYDVNTNYISKDEPLGLSEGLRRRVRDWYCLNPYFYNGGLTIMPGRPDIKVGSRVRIPGKSGGEDDQRTYYAETVTNSYQFGQGTSTQVGVTRGWIGSDASLVDALGRMVSRYDVPDGTPAGVDFTPSTTDWSLV